MRPTSGEPAIRIGLGRPETLSPDGKWAFTHRDDEWWMVPIGAGVARRIVPDRRLTVIEADWAGDGRRIVVAGREEERRTRIYLLDLASGQLQPLTTDEGAFLPENAVTLDGQHFFVVLDGRVWLYSLAGGAPRAVPHLRPGERLLQWSPDGRFLFVRTASGAGQPDIGSPATVERIEVGSGARTPWLRLAPHDPAGVMRLGPVVLRADGHAYCYTYLRAQGDLFLVDRLR